jgi:hypothetical protein
MEIMIFGNGGEVDPLDVELEDSRLTFPQDEFVLQGPVRIVRCRRCGRTWNAGLAATFGMFKTVVSSSPLTLTSIVGPCNLEMSAKGPALEADKYTYSGRSQPSALLVGALDLLQRPTFC